MNLTPETSGTFATLPLTTSCCGESVKNTPSIRGTQVRRSACRGGPAMSVAFLRTFRYTSQSAPGMKRMWGWHP